MRIRTGGRHAAPNRGEAETPEAREGRHRRVIEESRALREVLFVNGDLSRLSPASIPLPMVQAPDPADQVQLGAELAVPFDRVIEAILAVRIEHDGRLAA